MCVECEVGRGMACGVGGLGRGRGRRLGCGWVGDGMGVWGGRGRGGAREWVRKSTDESVYDAYTLRCGVEYKSMSAIRAHASRNSINVWKYCCDVSKKRKTEIPHKFHKNSTKSKWTAKC